MQLEGLEQLISGIVMSVLGIGVVVKRNPIARICNQHKRKIFGEGTHDHINETVVRFLLALIGIVFVLASLLQVSRFIVG